MSATAQPWALRLSRRMTVFSCVLSFSLLSPSLCISPSLSLSFYLSQFIFILSAPFFCTVSILVYTVSVTPHISLFLLHKSVCPHFYSNFQMPLHANWSIKAREVYCISKHGYSSDIRRGFQDCLETFLGNIVIFQVIYSTVKFHQPTDDKTNVYMQLQRAYFAIKWNTTRIEKITKDTWKPLRKWSTFVWI